MCAAARIRRPQAQAPVVARRPRHIMRANAAQCAAKAHAARDRPSWCWAAAAPRRRGAYRRRATAGRKKSKGACPAPIRPRDHGARRAGCDTARPRSACDRAPRAAATSPRALCRRSRKKLVDDGRSTKIVCVPQTSRSCADRVSFPAKRAEPPPGPERGRRRKIAVVSVMCMALKSTIKIRAK